jgi:xanthine dehydrogenase accessory factor
MSLYGTDREILTTAIDWLKQGHRLALVTVVRTWGSSPRPIGSLMLMRVDGVHAGSVSGGCVEEDLVTRYRDQQLASSFPSLIDYGINRQEATRFGLPCGGRLELLVEELDNQVQLQTLLDNIKNRDLILRQVCLNTGEVSLHPADASEDFAYTNDYVRKVFGPRWQMLLIGAGHLSQYVASIALMMDYQVIVCDPREEYEQGWIQSDSDPEIEFVRMMPDDAVQAYATHTRSIVITLAHDPKLDDMALMDALKSRAFYVGAIGSLENNEKRRERLKDLGLGTKQLQRLHAPVGLPIGSHTPAEIAVSILAEITALRHEAGVLAPNSVSAA